ncbi:CdaR family transcriptional regulator [Parafrankia colletiae]|uniref:CdaR family transcriptional regulator n=1 Tax=Parafrankia colletiae TaxID=573497 RepID=A0A1S1QMU8_9ACTN|nr:helix-turn-helix domain-containing protein [Parafrankia colletiae]MCK9902099.1 helix-turn-helix domain-containing protein [Frankia sp. Cpl3]OHV34909.1 CdaR family transcriptional regulator [Parafrankia colletiae]
MKELAGRLAALDPDASAAVRAVVYFDQLVEGRAGLEAIVRGVALLAGAPARLVDGLRGVHVEVDIEGRRRAVATAVDSDWLSVPLTPGEPAAVWLERPGPAGPVEAVVLERAAGACRAFFERTSGRSSVVAADGARRAATEVLLDQAASPRARRMAAVQLGLDPHAPARALAFADGTVLFEAVPAGASRDPVTTRVADRRTGVGPAVPVLDLPSSWHAARTALRFTAHGTAMDPGPRLVHADQLGGLAVLATAVGPTTPAAPDVQALDRAATTAPWMLTTLEAVTTNPSLRAAAVTLTIHHSTLQERLHQAEHMLGWSVHDPNGRLRLQLAFALRRLHHNHFTATG